MWKNSPYYRPAGPSHRRNYLCPLCRIPRQIALRISPFHYTHVLQVGLTAGVFAGLLHPWWGFRGLWLFCPLWVVFEGIYRIRLRSLLGCPNCGFDPYLFLSDETRAKREIHTHWAAKLAAVGRSSTATRPETREGSGRLPGSR